MRVQDQRFDDLVELMLIDVLLQLCPVAVEFGAITAYLVAGFAGRAIDLLHQARDLGADMGRGLSVACGQELLVQRE